MAVRKRNKERDRLASSLVSSLGASLPDSGGSYEVSSAFTVPERRRFLGTWAIAEHTVDGQPYIDTFAASVLRGAPLFEPSYASIYDFREAICVKRVMIQGLVELPEGRAEFSYRLSAAVSWELERGFLVVRPELAYQSTSLDGKSAAVRELPSSGERTRIAYRFERGGILLEEGADVKFLTRGEG
jgi:hypothetical protein